MGCSLKAVSAGIALTLTVVLSASTVADFEETEYRLERAGVEIALRARIHDAIDRGTRFLIEQQEENGSFREHWTRGGRPSLADPVHTTLLCALALQHAGTPKTDAVALRAFEWAASLDPKDWTSIQRSVRSAGLALAFADAVPDSDLPTEEIAASLVEALDSETGYWGNALPAADRPPIPRIHESQVAALGLWCAKRQGIDLPTDVWKRHARALHDQQTQTGSWRYHPDQTLAAFGHTPDPRVDNGTPFGRYVGLANLTLARAALRDGGITDSRLRLAVRRAKRRLNADTVELLRDPAGILATGTLSTGDKIHFERRGGSLGRPGDGAYQKLWSLELACILADLPRYKRIPVGSRKPERRSWFTDGAEWLLLVQDASGGWSPTAGTPVTPPSETDTAYAILFLVRAASAWHPTSPRPVNADPGQPK